MSVLKAMPREAMLLTDGQLGLCIGLVVRVVLDGGSGKQLKYAGGIFSRDRVTHNFLQGLSKMENMHCCWLPGAALFHSLCASLLKAMPREAMFPTDGQLGLCLGLVVDLDWGMTDSSSMLVVCPRVAE